MPYPLTRHERIQVNRFNSPAHYGAISYFYIMTDLITWEQLKTIGKLSDSKRIYLPFLNATLHKYDITTAERISAFLAQLLHESGGFNYVREIASGKAYEGRIDLGNTVKGDGVRFKGRGLIQITGRNNYAKYSRYRFGDDRLLQSPELLEQPEYAVDSAGWFWSLYKNLNQYADKPNEWRTKSLIKGKLRDKFEYITYRINGGFNGYADRVKYWDRARELLHSV